MTGPFASVALELVVKRRVAVIPLGGEDGKVPLVTWQRWRHPPGRTAIADLAAKHPGANIGLLTGLSGLTVVDVDDPGLIDVMLRRCGATPLITATPRGGSHLWYRAAGERSTNLRESEGLAVDIKAAGGLVVVPPSIAGAGPAAGRVYSFACGSWDELAALPQVYPGSLPTVERQGAAVRHLRAVRPGLRNNTLLRLLLREVRFCDSEADLLDVATTLVDRHFELSSAAPFPPSEIAKTVRSAWQMEQEDRNWAGKEAKIMTTASEFIVLQANPDGFVLWMMLRWAHCADPEPFAVACKAMTEAELIDGWRDWRRYHRALAWLLEVGFLERVHAGRGAEPHRYRLANPPVLGAQNVPSRPAATRLAEPIADSQSHGA